MIEWSVVVAERAVPLLIVLTISRHQHTPISSYGVILLETRTMIVSAFMHPDSRTPCHHISGMSAPHVPVSLL